MVLAALALGGTAAPGQAPRPDAPKRHVPAEAELAALRERLDALGRALAELRARPPADPRLRDDLLADVAVLHKAAEWALREGSFAPAAAVGWTGAAIDLGTRRAEALAEGRAPWRAATGGTVRGYVSKLDGSAQPYAVYVPATPLPPDGRYRLDVVLHGRDGTISEVKFAHQHEGKPHDADAPGLVLHVYGRGNNAYRWAGEADVFEAIDAVKRAYPVDDRRVVLRGFSMGGAGAWHLGLHHPQLWCAVEAGAGFSESRKYLKRDDFTPVESALLHIYDAVDYARNAFNLPVAGYGGEDDPQLAASRNVTEALRAAGYAMQAEGLVTKGEALDYLAVVGAKIGHKVDPASAAILEAFRDEHAAAGIPEGPRPVRFVTYTLKYNRAPFVSVERLVRHYEPATVELTPDPDAETASLKAEGVRVVGVDRRVAETLAIDGQEFPLRSAAGGLLPLVYFRKADDGWRALDHEQSLEVLDNVMHAKTPGLQGPIDDAFTGPFLCVRGTGTPWNPAVHAWADARLEAFRTLWRVWMRGELPVKDDTAVTEEDVQTKHLVLFGDPGSNAWIRRLTETNKLPLSWTRQEVKLAGTFPAADAAPVLIAPNPLAPGRYVVINSGHTFGPKDFAGTNALLYPRLGDYAVFRLGTPDAPPAASGFFDEMWRLPAGAK
jgi:hypothetical protein